ncbi:trans-3-hydroxy-L-proline dehydratase [Bufo gargarizans]|uniref:trans-3-hydroxy-L-proline dehydratase n=1 Tax=Bufo gargarizans TaxID=30331 RepID=UPI001CF1120D|nr:trans-3-hydroxy-L-proline dehydratase [Bufo gargarizans]
MSALKLRLPPNDGPVLSVVDMHTGGEPLRIVLSGAPVPSGSTLLEKRRWVRENMDWVRRVLMLEPRGHQDMYGALLVPSEEAEAQLGVLFMHNAGYSTMCGHAVIALGRFALDYGLVDPQGPETQVNMHCPCGLVRAYVSYSGGRSGRVRFHSVPAFTLCTDVPVDVPGYGTVVVDIAYGGAFYAFVSAERFGLDVCSSKTRDLVDAAAAVSDAVKAQVKISHPDSEDLAFLYGTILTDGKDVYSEEPTANICVFADSQVDRSPTGSGVTARIALQYHKGFIQLEQTRTFKSGTTGSFFTGKAIKETVCGDHRAVVVEVSGQAHYTGTASFTLESDDPLKDGFLLK